MRALREGLARSLDAPVEALGALALPEESYDRKRNQYHSTRILKVLLEDVPPDALKVLGRVEEDLFIPILTFIFWEAQLGGTASLVSAARLRQEFYGLDPDGEILRDRLQKECLHELGHNFGLVHCRDRRCVMYLSNTVRDVDGKDREYCRSCRAAVIDQLGAWRV